MLASFYQKALGDKSRLLGAGRTPCHLGEGCYGGGLGAKNRVTGIVGPGGPLQGFDRVFAEEDAGDEGGHLFGSRPLRISLLPT